VLAPWRARFPGVEVSCEQVIGQAGAHLVDVSGSASLVVVGRRGEGALGPAAHTVLRHAAAPVAIVPHL